MWLILTFISQIPSFPFPSNAAALLKNYLLPKHADKPLQVKLYLRYGLRVCLRIRCKLSAAFILITLGESGGSVGRGREAGVCPALSGAYLRSFNRREIRGARGEKMMSSKMTGRRREGVMVAGCVLKGRAWCPRRLARHRPLSPSFCVPRTDFGAHDNAADGSSSFPRLEVPALQEVGLLLRRARAGQSPAQAPPGRSLKPSLPGHHVPSFWLRLKSRTLFRGWWWEPWPFKEGPTGSN